MSGPVGSAAEGTGQYNWIMCPNDPKGRGSAGQVPRIVAADRLRLPTTERQYLPGTFGAIQTR